jgi:hypothetical protein
MWRGRRGRYEAWFLTLSSPDGRSGYWIRYTLRSPVAGPREPRLWFARFSRDDPVATFGINAGADHDAFRSEPGAFEIRIAEALLRSGRAVGEVAGAGHEARWDLEFDTGQPTFRLLPEALYGNPVVPTRPFTPNPDLRYRGTIEVDGRVMSVDGFPGQQGHVEGSRHGERWAWAFCNGFDLGGVVFQALSAQGRRGPLTTPHLSFAGLRWEGRWIRLRGVARRKSWSLGRWRIRLAGRRHRLEGEVWADPRDLVQARYLDPDDTPRWCHNSEVSSCRLVLWERGAGGWHQRAELASDGTTHAEWAGRTPAPGVETVHVEVP